MELLISQNGNYEMISLIFYLIQQVFVKLH